MCAIESIQLQNFQSHHNSHLELSDGVNIIHGPTDNGKSVIIRAIRWVIINRPTGDKFRTHETKQTTVTLETDNFIIQRRKSDSKNEYKMDDVVYKALRSSVPEDISTALNLSEANIQSQHEVYFLVDKSPGHRSKQLNEVAGLQVMDKVLKKVNSEVRSINSKIKAVNDILIDAQNEILNLEWINSADSFLNKLENFSNKIEDSYEKYIVVIKILNALDSLNKKKKEFLSDSFSTSLDIFIKKNKKIKKLEDTHRHITNLLSREEELHSKLSSIVIIDTAELEKLEDKIASTQMKHNTILSIMNDIENLKMQHIQKKKALAETKNIIKTELKRLGICPTCRRKI